MPHRTNLQRLLAQASDFILAIFGSMAILLLQKVLRLTRVPVDIDVDQGPNAEDM